MTLATASTQVPAVRQHGGGRARRALLTQHPSGRPTRSTGGEIKSLCCAAAGIIALASRPRGARAYPTTGVRRAAQPAASLRSPHRLHAQPVKGYGHRPQGAGREHVVTPHTRCNITKSLKAALFGPMLSPVPRGMERKNSKVKRHTAPESNAVFLRPCHGIAMAGRATDTRPERGRSPLGFTRVLNLPATMPARVRTFRLVLQALVKERFA